ncbi:MAG: peptide chain release factor N(5)-glutamine methyltransferase [Ramlibacter sp.]
MTLAEALAAAAALGLARLDAQLLLLHAMRRRPGERAWLLAHDGDSLDTGTQSQFLALCARRAGGEPIAYIVGRKEFFGLELRVDPRVLIPRPDTETLVEWALEVIGDDRPSVVDLGTGSGAIALAIKHHFPSANVEAVDASTGALEVAAENARRLGLDVAFRQASWLTGATSLYDLIVSNPPYVAAGDPHLAALGREPAQALVAGTDGLEDIRTIVAQAGAHLRPRGWLLLEHGYDQAAAVRDLLAAAGFASVTSRRDLAGIERCSGGQRLELG